jgi:hypothetical protein
MQKVKILTMFCVGERSGDHTGRLSVGGGRLPTHSHVRPDGGHAHADNRLRGSEQECDGRRFPSRRSMDVYGWGGLHGQGVGHARAPAAMSAHLPGKSHSFNFNFNLSHHQRIICTTTSISMPENIDRNKQLSYWSKTLILIQYIVATREKILLNEQTATIEID